jgi:hypothetical protein
MSESIVSERKQIEDRLRKKLREVSALEEKIRAANAYVVALRDVLKMFDGPEVGIALPSGKLRAGSAVAMARDVILAADTPVHLDEIIVAMGKPLNANSKSSLASSLAAYVRQNDIFTRTAPNTFGLVELGHNDLEDDEEFLEPPEGFGRQAIANDPFDDDVPF